MVSENENSFLQKQPLRSVPWEELLLNFQNAKKDYL